MHGTPRRGRRLAVGLTKGKPLERAGFPRQRAAGGGREPSRGLEGHSATRRQGGEAYRGKVRGTRGAGVGAGK